MKLSITTLWIAAAWLTSSLTSLAEDEGIVRVSATATQIVFTIRGMTKPMDLMEMEPYHIPAEPGALTYVHRVPEAVRKSVIPRFSNKRDRLYSGFILADRTPDERHLPAGPVRYVEEMLGISKSEAPFPAAASKKGLQVQMVDDALALGVKHAALNVNLTGLVDLHKSSSSLRWEMDGETFWFNRAAVEQLPVKALSDAGVVVSFILLAYQSGNAELDTVMLHPNRAAKLPNNLAAFNTITPDGLKRFKACLEFLADRFSGTNLVQGRVANYILGNEVTAHWHWANMGEVSAVAFIEDYERALRVAHTAIRKASATARIYVSLDHHWNLTYEGRPTRAIAGMTLLEGINGRAKAGGDYDWHVAYHPYPENLGDPRTWLDKSAPPRLDAPRITFKNLEQLPAFLGQASMLFHGQPRRVILSEQGFHSDNTPEGDQRQAAAYCFAWMRVNALSGIDSFILHRHVDNAGEGGLNLGLWRRKKDTGSTPGERRPIYEVFQNADTPERDAAFRFALPIIGITNWNQISAAAP